MGRVCRVNGVPGPLREGIQPLGGFSNAQFSHQLVVVVPVQAGRVDELNDPAYQGDFPRPPGDGPPCEFSVDLDPDSPFYPPRQFMVPVVWEGGTEPAQQQLSCSERIVSCQDRGVWGDVVDCLSDEQLLKVRVSRWARRAGLGFNNVTAVGWRACRTGGRDVDA